MVMASEALYSVAVCVVITEVLLCLLPDGSLKRFCRFAIGMLLSIMLLGVVATCSLDFDISFSEQVELNTEKNYKDVVEDVYNKAQENIIN